MIKIKIIRKKVTNDPSDSTIREVLKGKVDFSNEYANIESIGNIALPSIWCAINSIKLNIQMVLQINICILELTKDRQTVIGIRLFILQEMFSSATKGGI